MNDIFLKDVISKYKTPFYVFDTDILVRGINRIKSVVGSNIDLCYAMKANPFIIKEIESNIDGFEVCSPGEFAICEKSEISMGKVIMSGVFKNPKDIEYAIQSYGNKIVYTVESLLQLKLIAECTKKLKKKINVLLRLTAGNQFGMDETIINEIIVNRNEYEYIHIEGIQFYSGTQKKSAKKIVKELDMLDNFCEGLEREHGFTVEKLEYGPGLSVCYFEEDKDCEEETLNVLSDKLKNMKFKGKITLEMGRFIAAYCGTYITSVVDMKENKNQNYCIVDGGIHQVNYYGQIMAMKKPYIIHWNEENEGEEKEWNVCGSLCTVSDILVKQYPLKNLKLQDKLIFKKVGAYSITEAMALFLSRDLPKVILYSKEKGFRLVRDSFLTSKLNYIQNTNN